MKELTVTLSILGLLFLALILSTFIGSVAGWAVSLIFSETTEAWLIHFNLPFQLWEVGAMLGFIGAFFKQPGVKS